MKRQQLYTRLGPDVVERVIRRFNEREMSLQDAVDALGVGKTKVYNLRTQWLAAGRNASFPGASGGDHRQAWPAEAVAHLKTLTEASKDDGPDYELYADELARKCDFVRDRPSVRKFCEKNLMPLLRSTFPVERKKPEDKCRRWEAASFGEIYQHDSTPRHIWGLPDAQQHVILSLDDASRKVTAQRVCERETLLGHFAMIEESILRYGRPEAYYTDGFTMFGKEGEDLCSQFGRMCRAPGMNHRIAPTPQAKGKVERAMRTFQHRIVVVLKAEGVDNEARANLVAREHIDFWCRTHVNDETGEVPDERMQRLVAEGKTRIRAAPNEKVLRLFLSRHIPRSVELGCRIEFMGRKWRIARTLRKTVWLAIRPENAGFYVLETRPGPTNPVVPRILAKYRF